MTIDEKYMPSSPSKIEGGGGSMTEADANVQAGCHTPQSFRDSSPILVEQLASHTVEPGSSPSKIEGAGGSMTVAGATPQVGKQEKYPKNAKRIKKLRRDLRNNSTLAEKALWNWLKGCNIEGLRFRRQYSVENFILDFYCPKLKLCIELDGDYHFHVNQPLSDAERDQYLKEKYRIYTLRFENKIVFKNPQVIIDAILNYKESLYNFTQTQNNSISSPSKIDQWCKPNAECQASLTYAEVQPIDAERAVAGSMTEADANVQAGCHTPQSLRDSSPILGEQLIDEKYMWRALQLARQGGGHTSPNPMVGAVVVHDDKIIGEGFHRCCGQAHAEVNAIASVRDESLLPASTIYVTLEPCSHYGKTPPCAKLLIDKSVKRVVVGTLDPFEKVSGRGVAMLREAGIDVVVGVLEKECRELNKRFFTAHTTGLPWVLLKWAQSSDGYLANEDGSVRFSTPLTLSLMHRERSMVDAIVVGAGTVKIDNPSLTTRHWSGNSPLRVVLDRNLSIPSNCQLLNDGDKTLIYNETKEDIKGCVEWAKLDTKETKNWLRDLYHRGITSVMVEGGANVLQQLVDADAWNEIRIEIAPVTLGGGIRAPKVDMSRAAHQEIDGNVLSYIAKS